jgi:hypothetical protein
MFVTTARELREQTSRRLASPRQYVPALDDSADYVLFVDISRFLLFVAFLLSSLLLSYLICVAFIMYRLIQYKALSISDKHNLSLPADFLPCVSGRVAELSVVL